MNLLTLFAKKNMLILRKRELITSGSVNVYKARFEFSEDWEGLTRTAVFRAGSEARSVLLDESGQCVIPWEVLSTPRAALRAGVYGTRDGEVVLPTVWENLGIIQDGTALGEEAQPPTPGVYEQRRRRHRASGTTRMLENLTVRRAQRANRGIPVPLAPRESGASQVPAARRGRRGQRATRGTPGKPGLLAPQAPGVPRGRPGGGVPRASRARPVPRGLRGTRDRRGPRASPERKVPPVPEGRRGNGETASPLKATIRLRRRWRPPRAHRRPETPTVWGPPSLTTSMSSTA